MTEDKMQQAALALKQFADGMKTPGYLDALRLFAQNDFNRFQAWRHAGFTATQALELVILKDKP